MTIANVWDGDPTLLGSISRVYSPEKKKKVPPPKLISRMAATARQKMAKEVADSCKERLKDMSRKEGQEG